MFGTARDLDAIAEYADASVRTVPRRGSLVPVSGRRGVNAWLYARWGNRGNAVYTFVGGLLTIGVSGAVAWVLQEPLLFPSLGAAAFLFFETPMAEVASPRNTVIGHATGALVATLWLLVFGLQHDTADLAQVDAARAAAVALSVACTGGLLRLLRAAHPPAGATTVIVSLGLLHTTRELVALAAGVLLLTASAHVVNRLLGVPAPRW